MRNEFFDGKEGADLVWDLAEMLEKAHAQLDAVISANDDPNPSLPRRARART
jgi:hypothetical protein